jgi:hypothetical protein
MMELYLHSPICLHGVVLNYLSTETSLPYSRYPPKQQYLATKVHFVRSQMIVILTTFVLFSDAFLNLQVVCRRLVEYVG